MAAPLLSRRAALIAAWPLAQVWPAWAAEAAEAVGTNGAGNAARSPNAETVMRLATAWRLAKAEEGSPPDRIGVLEIDWAAGRLRVLAEVPVPGRAHGLLAMPDGGFVAVANRPGLWLLRCDPMGQVQRRWTIGSDTPQRTFNGHVEASADGAWLFTTETDPRADPHSGSGWISVRDARTFARVAEMRTNGLDPHQLLRAADGTLLVANGGIPRDREGRKIDAERMAPSLVRLHPGRGSLLGSWRLDDARLSIRHLAWAQPDAKQGAAANAGPPLLGVALQAEHENADERRDAPALAVWDGETLRIASRDASAGGYAGDIAAGPGGGFVISAQKQRRGLWWQPAQPDRLTLLAELTEPCALAAVEGGVLISAGRGAARWQVQQAPAMLPWPVPLAPDNHWVVLRQA